ncbi:hypothetical protein [Streptomyces sp. NPDC059166]|uniref:hypothetical protein n=1 Tax=Streptomyces sp. NPDC059166 TaxID=3346752 RepID=UPI0036CA0375
MKFTEFLASCVGLVRSGELLLLVLRPVLMPGQGVGPAAGDARRGRFGLVVGPAAGHFG